MKKPKILLYDIETAPNIVAVFNFWVQGNVVWTDRDWYIMSVAWKWLGSKKVEVRALPDYETYKKDKTDDIELVKELHELFSEADIIIAHNGMNFDTKKASARFIYHKLPPPSPYKQVDTRQEAKKLFRFDSNRLDEIGRFLRLGRKIPTGGYDLWRKCLEGDLKAWKRMKKYNTGDVELLELVYLEMRPYMTTHPNIGLMEGNRKACPNCGSLRVHSRGYKLTRVNKMRQYQCYECKAWSSAPETPNSQLR